MMVNASYSIHPIQDTIYNDDAWATKVQNIVNEINPFENSKIGIIGHKKDESSFYLDMFPQWDLIEVSLIEELSASQIRELYFKEDYNPNFIRNVIPVEVLEFLNRFSKTEDCNQILREIKVIENYKIPYVGLPYPPIFVTVDAVLVQSGHILMIRRRAEPGRGLLALPGGFLDALSDKSLEDAMIREVREETQLKVPSPVLRGNIVEAKVFDAIERSTRGRTITHAFHINLPNGELPKVKGGSDATSAKWIPISKITPNECFEDHYEIINYFTGV
jgi:bifunctional NMN adenylyltransferase/nudix hydrolase